MASFDVKIVIRSPIACMRVSIRLCLDWWKGMEWKGMEWSGILFYCLDYLKNDGKEWNMMEPIPSHSISYTHFSSLPNWGEWDGMKDQILHKIMNLLFCPLQLFFFLFKKKNSSFSRTQVPPRRGHPTNFYQVLQCCCLNVSFLLLIFQTSMTFFL